MEVAICLFAILGFTLAIPQPPLAWEDIKGENIYIKPVANYTVEHQPDGRIVGGFVVDPGSVPYQVGMIINGWTFCGGSVISTEFVLTAAHCVFRSSFVELIYGAHNIQNREPTQVRLTSSDVITHPQYIAETATNDIALVRSPTPIVLSAIIQIIELAPANAETFAGSVGFLTGWGRISDTIPGITSDLRGLSANIITNEACAAVYSTDIIVESTICTSGVGNVGGCSGDSGGPLVVDNVQVGVVSFVSSDGCEVSLPTGFGRVSFFRNWIYQNSGV